MHAPLIDEIPARHPGLADTLASAGLPTADLTEPGRRFFRFRDAAGALVGYLGWELAGAAALLRSLAVVPERRGQGWSRVMTDWALQQLRSCGIAEVYVLTAGSEPLARKLGFARIERSEAPLEIRASRQVESLCPASAVLMWRRLGSERGI